MQFKQRTVLVVEDEALIRLCLVAALEDTGFEVLEAANGLQAIGLLGTRHVDAIVTDVDMPGGVDGFDLINLVARDGHIQVKIVTSGGHRPTSQELPDGVRFISKPYRLEDVLGEIGRQLDEAARVGSLSMAG